MHQLIAFKHVDSYAKEEFGIKGLNLSVEIGGRYHISATHRDQKSCLLGLFEGRYRPDSGVVTHYGQKFTTQSDRNLLGYKAMKQNAGLYLAVERQPFFFFNGKKRNKRNFMEDIKARHIRHFPIYKLRGEEKVMFALLAMVFQETGLLLISEVFSRISTPATQNLLLDIVAYSRCGICIITEPEDDLEQVKPLLEAKKFEAIDLNIKDS